MTGRGGGNLAPVTGSDKSFCLGEQRQPRTLSVPTTLALFGTPGPGTHATSCQFDGAPPGARRDVGIHARVVTPVRKMHSRVSANAACCRAFHQTRFISRGSRDTSGGIQGSEVARVIFTHLDVQAPPTGMLPPDF